MSAQQNGQSSLDEPPLTFDEISKLFSLPISDAASILGVCSSVLKKICRDNGVVRWPYRKFLSGKSVEEIKKEAAREKNKELAELSKAARIGNEASANSVVSSTFGSQLHNKTLGSVQDTSKVQGASLGHILQQQGRPQNMLNSSLAKGIPTYLDEFKHGFPTDGLSTSSIRWWGSSSLDGTEEIFGDRPTTDQEDKQQSLELAGDKADLSKMKGEKLEEDKQQSMELAGDEADHSKMEDGKLDRGTEESDIGPQGTALLLSVRKRAAEEGREALKLSHCRGYGADKLGGEKLLLKLFKSSSWRQWRYGSFET